MKYFYTTSKLSDNMHETPEGFLVCVGVSIARTGEMIYGEGETPLEVGDDGTVKVTRDEKDVFNPKTMASFEGKPVTITHPTEFVTPQNWSRLAKGVIQNVRRGENDRVNDLIADLLITDSQAIGLIKNGLREVSCGYEANYIQEDDGEGKQTRIIGNHLALVDQGRAGSSYAIFDHKRKGAKEMSKFEKILAKLGLTKDSAMAKALDEAMKEGEEKKDESKDAEGAMKKSYDELVQICKDLGEKVAALSAGKKDSKDAEGEEKKDEKKDKAGDEEVAPALEDRLKALEASVAKLLERESKEDEVPVDDEDMEEGEEAEDDDFEESTMTGDTASRVEILAPGMNAKAKDAKKLALVACYATKDGKQVIESLTGGKAPTYDSAERVNALFIAASEVLKASRTSELSKTKQTRDSDFGAGASTGPMTAEQMNELNAKHYKRA